MTKRKTVTVAGVPMRVVSDNEAENADYVVCMLEGTKSPFTDNLVGLCCRCGRRVIFRWHAPRNPKKICIECAPQIAKFEQ